MKLGRTISELAAEVARQAGLKRDFVAPAARIGLLPPTQDRPHLALHLSNGNGGHSFEVGETAHDQIANRLGIPVRYYERMQTEAPALLAENVNTWLEKHDGAYLVRTLDGKARALLSERYRPLDHADLVEAIMPAISQRGLEVMSCEITEKRLYLKAIDPCIYKDVPTGRKMGDGSHVFFDTMCAALVISNSEIGWGALSIESGFYTKACTNLALIAERGMRKYHVGGKFGSNDEGFYELLTDQTRRLTDAAVFMQARDLVASALDQTKFNAMCDDVARMSQDRIEKDPVQVVELAQKKFQLSDTERGSVLKHLIEGGDLTRYGLFNAVTRSAEEARDYDRATQIERMGGEIIELGRNDWEALAAKF